MRDETDVLERIEAELRPNGGTSLRDVINDIQERVHESDAFQRASLNIHDVAIVRFNSKGQVVHANRQLAHLVNMSIDELKGDGWINFIYAPERDLIMRKWRGAVESGREFSENATILCADGTETVAHMNIFRETDYFGKIRGFLGVIMPFNSKLCPYGTLCFRKEICDYENKVQEWEVPHSKEQ
jgi:PAS domain S-box-containing protein